LINNRNNDRISSDKNILIKGRRKMLKNTKNAFISIINEIKLVCKIIKYSSIVVSLVYFLIALLTKTGNFIANIISLSLFIVYTIFEISTRNI
jgi:hypothetical protein